jgi:type VI secretion system protein ImpM
MSHRTAPGYYGKLPNRGDFVSRRLPREFVEPWDQWLQSAIACSRDQLGDEWLNLYLTSPIWRFVLRTDICGEAAWAGVLVPSVDKVGRYFPLTVAVSIAADSNPFAVARDADSWFERAEDVALSALEDKAFTLDAFDAKVQALGPTSIGENPAVPAYTAPRGGAWHVPIASVNALADAYPQLLRRLVDKEFRVYSLWWTSGSERVDPSLLVCGSLPPVDGYAALLDGLWQTRLWDSWPLSQPLGGARASAATERNV